MRNVFLMLAVILLGATAAAEPPSVLAQNPDEGDYAVYHGASVASDGEWLAVGAKSSPSNWGKGGVTLFRLNEGGAWEVAQELDIESLRVELPELDPIKNRFGRSVALHGDVLVVGCTGVAVRPAIGIYRLVGDEWILQQGIMGDYWFGWAVAAGPHGIAVSGLSEGAPGEPMGRPLLYREDAGTWVQTGFAPPPVGPGTMHGISMAMDGGRLLVGGLGVVSYHEWDGATWQPAPFPAIPVLVDGSGRPGEPGLAVALSGDRAVVTVPYRVGLSGYVGGSALVYEHDGAAWQLARQIDFVPPSPATATCAFGTSAAINGDTICIGGTDAIRSHYLNVNETIFPFDRDPGFVSVHTRDGAGDYPGQAIDVFLGLRSPGAGFCVAPLGDGFITGAPGLSPWSSFLSSTAFTLAESNGTWSVEGELRGRNPAAGDNFGFRLAVLGDALVATSSFDWGETVGRNGSISVLEGFPSSPARVAVLRNPDVTDLGMADATYSVPTVAPSIEGDRLHVFSPCQAGTCLGTFRAREYQWLSPDLQLVEESDVTLPVGFGSVPAPQVAAGTLLLPDAADDQAASNAGIVHVYGKVPGGWAPLQVLQPAGLVAGSAFGSAVAFKDGLLLVGAPGDTSATGRVQAYANVGGEWVETQELTTPGGPAMDGFGRLLAIGDGYAFVASSTAVFAYEITGGALVPLGPVALGPDAPLASARLAAAASRVFVSIPNAVVLCDLDGGSFAEQERIALPVVPTTVRDIVATPGMLFVGDASFSDPEYNSGVIRAYQLGPAAGLPREMIELDW